MDERAKYVVILTDGDSSIRTDSMTLSQASLLAERFMSVYDDFMVSIEKEGS
jgi:hypothetical protein